MIEIRRSEERGLTQIDWLESRHTFSFDQYYDPAHVQFRSLRVLNEDRVAPGAGFPTHPHRDMEIITYVLEGALEHRDSMGNGAIIRPGEIQKMTAGTGVMHSEFNPAPAEPVHLLQIWIVPDQRALKPGYEQHKLPPGELDGKLAHLAGPDGVVTIHQDAHLYAARLERGQEVEYKLAPGRHAWAQLARGAGKLNGLSLHAGDGAGISEELLLKFQAEQSSELLLFDLA